MHFGRMKRIQREIICNDLKKKMVLLVGPRQIGKTWLAKEIMRDYINPVYLNYDHRIDRQIILNEGWLPNSDLIVLDEIHKMKNWKNYLKGLFDTKPESLHILVTGSARLETFRQAGDSLAGRYFLHHLFPLSYKEASFDMNFPLDFLIERGGFPEPLLAENVEDANRWRSQYTDSLVREDILDFENIQDLKAIRLVLELLQARVGSPVSYKSISEDIGRSPNTIKKYIQVLESLFIVFRIIPFSRNIARSLLKEPKLYFFDTGLVKGDDGIKLENYLALSLLKQVRYITDTTGLRMDLKYLRTKDGKEVDFCITENDEPKLMIEAKYSNTNLGSGIQYFHKKYGISAVQIVKNLRKEFLDKNIPVRKAENFLKELNI